MADMVIAGAAVGDALRGFATRDTPGAMGEVHTDHDDAAVLITGASRGVGRELALGFARQRRQLILVARSEDRLRTVADEARKAGAPEVAIMAADLSDADDVARLVERISELADAGTHIDTLINNAAILVGEPFRAQNSETVRHSIALNCAAPTQLITAVLPGMIARGSGRILYVASIAGIAPLTGMSVYSATKAYAIRVADSLRRELRGTGVTVTTLIPGPIETDMLEDVMRADVGMTALMPNLDPRDVAYAAIEGLDGGRHVVVPGLMNAMLYYGTRLAPPVVSDWLANIRLPWVARRDTGA
ncbi:MAG: SDR family NAD(P)-dependent oxidoreductase [Pseudomonadota bacterium]